ncbi:MAG: CheB methylesterase domain-containing protein [Armatimonadota bacterium]|nr:CheB methylesterase domain-containing protein [Armatimonadota bacterium]
MENANYQRLGQKAPDWVVVFGATAGGPQALSQILPQFPVNIPAAVLVAQHMRPGFTRVLAAHFQRLCRLPVCEPEDGQALLASRIVVCPSNARVSIARVGFSPTPAYCINIEHPGDSGRMATSKIDTLMISAAEVFGKRAIGVLLTGIGTDGREGMRAIHEAGGITIAQDQATSVVHALPSAAIEAGVVGEILPLWDIAERITQIVGGRSDAVAA